MDEKVELFRGDFCVTNFDQNKALISVTFIEPVPNLVTDKTEYEKRTYKSIFNYYTNA